MSLRCPSWVCPFLDFCETRALCSARARRLPSVTPRAPWPFVEVHSQYRPLASDRAAHSAPHTKKGGQHTDTERRAHTHGLKPKHASGLKHLNTQTYTTPQHNTTQHTTTHHKYANTHKHAQTCTNTHTHTHTHTRALCSARARRLPSVSPRAPWPFVEVHSQFVVCAQAFFHASGK